jgi:phosphoribosylaminoimidazole carboxylase PurE protein
MSDTLVVVFMGSESDRELMNHTSEMLKRFDIAHDVIVSSAHRSPEKTRARVRDAESRGVEVLIAGAGMSAHLPGAVAAETILPVIGVPLPGSALSGVDSLHSIVQMPAGVPVATMAIGKAGARNAAIFAAQILALKHERIRDKLREYRRELAG